jgi:hypothetical protein
VLLVSEVTLPGGFGLFEGRGSRDIELEDDGPHLGNQGALVVDSDSPVVDRRIHRRVERGRRAQGHFRIAREVGGE